MPLLLPGMTDPLAIKLCEAIFPQDVLVSFIFELSSPSSFFSSMMNFIFSYAKIGLSKSIRLISLANLSSLSIFLLLAFYRVNISWTTSSRLSTTSPAMVFVISNFLGLNISLILPDSVCRVSGFFKHSFNNLTLLLIDSFCLWYSIIDEV